MCGAIGAVAGLSVALWSCNAVFGIDGLSYDGNPAQGTDASAGTSTTTTGGGGGTTGTAGTTGSGGDGGAAGGGGCASSCVAGTSWCENEEVFTCMGDPSGCSSEVFVEDCATKEENEQTVFGCEDGVCVCAVCCSSAAQCPTGVSTADCPNGRCCPEGCQSTGETVLYATDTMVTGALAGRTGADQICQDAKPAELSCTNVRAFLSFSAADEIRDMPQSYGYSPALPLYFYHRVNQQLGQFATDWADALDGSISLTIADGTGNNGGSFNSLWTGAAWDGSLFADHCVGWTSETMDDYGGLADAFATSSWLHVSGLEACWHDNPILCACRL